MTEHRPARDHAGTLVALVTHYAAELAHYRRVQIATDRRMVALIEECRSATREKEALALRVAELERQIAAMDEPLERSAG